MVEKEEQVVNVFEAIQDKYDLIDTIISFGTDQPLRRKVLRYMDVKPGMTVLDSGSGTGKLTKMIRDSCESCRVISLDITEKMFRPSLLKNIEFVVASAERMPFEDSSIDRAASCFLTRNLSSVDRYFEEVKRVLKPGGILVNFDIFPPTNIVFSRLFAIYFYRMVPALGDWMTKSDSYTYLAKSVKSFIKPDQMAEKLLDHGFELLKQDIRMFGSVAIHAARKPDNIN